MNYITIDTSDIVIGTNNITYNDNTYNLDESLSKFSAMDKLLTNDNFLTFVNEQHDIVVYANNINQFLLIERDSDNVTQQQDDNTIGLILDLILLNINDNQPIQSKVDTGADTTSLRVSNIDIRKNPLDTGTEQVKFILNDQKYIKNVSGYHTIQNSDGAVEHRPYITLDVKFGDTIINNVAINLNESDGVQKQYQILAGLNLLKDLDYKIDVNEHCLFEDLTHLVETLDIIDLDKIDE